MVLDLIVSSPSVKRFKLHCCWVVLVLFHCSASTAKGLSLPGCTLSPISLTALLFACSIAFSILLLQGIFGMALPCSGCCVVCLCKTKKRNSGEGAHAHMLYDRTGRVDCVGMCDTKTCWRVCGCESTPIYKHAIRREHQADCNPCVVGRVEACFMCTNTHRKPQEWSPISSTPHSKYCIPLHPQIPVDTSILLRLLSRRT